jgi:hypothetical protein
MRPQPVVWNTLVMPGLDPGIHQKKDSNEG